MANYRAIYERLATRAVQQGRSNLEAFVGRLVDAGVPSERIEELLLDDLMSDGPIFENFFRALGGAGEGAVMAAENQGKAIGIIDHDKEIKKALGRANLADVITDADPEMMAEIEAASAELLELTWIATLVNTCHLCLPLHGITRTAQEWTELGYDPATIHPGNWNSQCHCKLIERRSFDRESEIAPLMRVKEKGARRTARGIASINLETAQRARDKAIESKEGRRVLRKLGKANEQETE